jgi:hypothetical protein
MRVKALAETAVVLLFCAWSRPLSAEGAGESLPLLPLIVAVAPDPAAEGRPAVTEAWLADQVQRANQILGQYGVTFRVVHRRPLGPGQSRLETRADRDALGSRLMAGGINLFVVASLRDVDEPSRYRWGVHWRPRHNRRQHFVILSAAAGPYTLAHELGHFFGNRHHSQVAGNLMSYTSAPGLPFLDARQIERLQQSARLFLDQGELVPAEGWTLGAVR